MTIKPIISPKYRSIVRMIDIDGTIIKHQDPDLPIEILPGCLEQVNEWYNAGDHIIFWTARDCSRYHELKGWLSKSGFKFHQLVCNKPYTHNMHIYDDNLITAHHIERNVGLAGYIQKDKRAGELLEELMII